MPRLKTSGFLDRVGVGRCHFEFRVLQETEQGRECVGGLCVAKNILDNVKASIMCARKVLQLFVRGSPSRFLQ